MRVPAKDTSPFEPLLATRCFTPITAITEIGKTRVGILRHYAPQTALAEYFSRPPHD